MGRDAGPLLLFGIPRPVSQFVMAFLVIPRAVAICICVISRSVLISQKYMNMTHLEAVPEDASRIVCLHSSQRFKAAFDEYMAPTLTFLIGLARRILSLDIRWVYG